MGNLQQRQTPSQPVYPSIIGIDLSADPDRTAIWNRPVKPRAVIWNEERRDNGHLSMDKRRNHGLTIELLASMREHEQILQMHLRMMDMPGNARCVETPPAPRNPQLVQWHLARSSWDGLTEDSREMHFQTWRLLLERESSIARITATIVMKGKP